MRTLGCILKGPPARWRINGLAWWKVDGAADGYRGRRRDREAECCHVDWTIIFCVQSFNIQKSHRSNRNTDHNCYVFYYSVPWKSLLNFVMKMLWREAGCFQMMRKNMLVFLSNLLSNLKHLSLKFIKIWRPKTLTHFLILHWLVLYLLDHFC